MFKAEDVKILRERTNAGMMDCKKALEASNGDTVSYTHLTLPTIA